MSRERRQPEDDGRTIADMSGLERRNPLGIGGLAKGAEKRAQRPEERAGNNRPWEDHSLSRSERWAAVFGAWKAAILIALAYVVGLGLVVLAITCLM